MTWLDYAVAAVLLFCILLGLWRGLVREVVSVLDQIHAAYPATNPVSPEDMLATIYYGLGIDPNAELHDPLGRPHRVVDGTPLTALF